MRLRRRRRPGPYRRLTAAAATHPLIDAAASIAFLFKQDPVRMLEGDSYDFAIRWAAAKLVSAARSGKEGAIEAVLDELLDD